MGRSSWLGPQELLQLDHWARLIVEAFGEVPYLVGSWDDDVFVLLPG